MAGLIPGAHLPTLETGRLRIRWLTATDVPALFAVFSDPEVVKYWSRPAMRDQEEAAGLLAEIHALFAEGSLYQWGIAVKADDRVIGTCTLAGVSAEHRRAEIGFALGRAWWGKGYATEAIGALLDFAFETLGLRRIEADVDPQNQRSARCIEQFGFQREGYARERYLIDDAVFDSVLYGLLRREYVRHTAQPG